VVPDELPESWIEAAEHESGHAVPTRLSEQAPVGRGMEAAVASVVDEVKRTVFPRFERSVDFGS
jgi:hypothetical protein